TRRQRLLKHFGSVREIRQASPEQLAKAPGMNKKAAQQVVDYFTAVANAESEPGDASIDPIQEPLYEGDDSDAAGQPDAERGAATDGGLGQDRATVAAHAAVDHREP